MNYEEYYFCPFAEVHNPRCTALESAVLLTQASIITLTIMCLRGYDPQTWQSDIISCHISTTVMNRIKSGGHSTRSQTYIAPYHSHYKFTSMNRCSSYADPVYIWTLTHVLYI